MAHNESTALVVDILSKRSLTKTLGKAGTSIQGTNLIVHHGITDILCQACKPIHILHAILESRDLSPFCQWDKVPENIV